VSNAACVAAGNRHAASTVRRTCHHRSNPASAAAHTVGITANVSATASRVRTDSTDTSNTVAISCAVTTSRPSGTPSPGNTAPSANAADSTTVNRLNTRT
jgi:hypothetical protein